MTCLSLLIYLHLVFNQQPLGCLSHLHETWPRHGVLRLELFLDTPPDNYDLRQSYAREYQYNALQPDGNASAVETPVSEPSVNSTGENPSEDNQTALILEPTAQESSSSNSLFDFDWFQQLLLDEQPIMEYSLEYGFLRLSPATRQRLNISVLLVKLGKAFVVRERQKRRLSSSWLDLSNNTCFGSGLSRFLLDQFIGYQEVLMSSVKQLAEKEAHKGYVRNVLTNDHFRFVSAAQNRRWWTYLVALSVMLIFVRLQLVSLSLCFYSILCRRSASPCFFDTPTFKSFSSSVSDVSFAERLGHRVLSVDLLRMLEHNAAVVFPAAPLLTVILALIGREEKSSRRRHLFDHLSRNGSDHVGVLQRCIDR